MFRKEFLLIFVINAVLTINQTIALSNEELEESCYSRDRDDDQCPNTIECACVETKAFGIHSETFERNVLERGGKECQHRVRRNVMGLSKDERLRYINAIKTLSTHPRFQRKYYDLLETHVHNFCRALHCPVFFLPWHRWFILRYENLLREIDPNFTLVYWDWSMVMGGPWDINLWDDNEYSFGGNGNPFNHSVDTGPFKQPEWQMVPGSGSESTIQMTRYFNYVDPGIPSPLHLAILFKLKPHEFKEWRTVYQSWHNNVHCSAFGVHSTMCNTPSAWTPEFYLHHAFIDKYWSEWQEQGDDYKYSQYYMNQTAYMQGTYHLPRDILDQNNQEGGVCISYEESPDDWIHKKLRNLTLDQLRDIKGVKIPGLDFVNTNSPFITAMQEFIKARDGLRNPINLKDLSGTDRARGFRLHDLMKMSAQNGIN